MVATSETETASGGSPQWSVTPEGDGVESAWCRLVHNDTVLETARMRAGSVHLIATSIPFGNQYEYGPSLNDMGHNEDNVAFWEQMDFLIPELLRVLSPGRVAAIHVKDRIRFGNVTGLGFPTLEPFSDECAAAFRKHGFQLMGRITVDTDVVRENAQTNRLTQKEQAKDGSKMGCGTPEYVLLFRKPPSDLSNGYADIPVRNEAMLARRRLRDLESLAGKAGRLRKEGKEVPVALTEAEAELERCGAELAEAARAYSVSHWQIDAAGIWRSSGDRLPDDEILCALPLGAIKRMWREYSGRGTYDLRENERLNEVLLSRGILPGGWQLFAPVGRSENVWTDIERIRTLNSDLARRGMEQHVCPLPLDIPERLIRRYTMPGEVVFDPFAGIGSVPYQALKMGRRARGTELNGDYWAVACGYCEKVMAAESVPTLFDLAALDEEIGKGKEPME